MHNSGIYVETFVVTDFQQNCRVLADLASGCAVVIDPGGEVDFVFEKIKAKDFKVESVFLTHAHIDHGGGVNRMLGICEQEYGTRPKLLSCGEEEKILRQSLSKQGIMFGVSGALFEDVPEPDIVLLDNDEVRIGEFKGRVLFTPGHSPGHLALYFDVSSFYIKEPGLPQAEEIKSTFLIAGDTLFAGSVGRTDLPGGDHRTLLNSIESKILVLPDDTVVLSGHGPATTVGNEKIHNPFLRG
jgi:glyoxylase-like metal-dependent hydrolase (beta-lactamase superfamily II)